MIGGCLLSGFQFATKDIEWRIVINSRFSMLVFLSSRKKSRVSLIASLAIAVDSEEECVEPKILGLIAYGCLLERRGQGKSASVFLLKVCSPLPGFDSRATVQGDLIFAILSWRWNHHHLHSEFEGLSGNGRRLGAAS